MPKQKTKTTDRDLTKALEEFEEFLSKGGDGTLPDDPEGDLTTEGESLQRKSKSETRKSKKSSRVSKMMSASDMASGSDESSYEEPKKKVKKSVADDSGSEEDGPDDESESMSSDGDSDESSDESSDEKPIGKSFREQIAENETVSKAVEVSDFLSALVEENGRYLDGLAKSLRKQLTKGLEDIVSKINQHTDARVAKSMAVQSAFNQRSGQALAAIGNLINEQDDMLKSLGNQPAAPVRGKAMLHKSDVLPLPGQSLAKGEPGNPGNEDELASQLAEVPMDKIFDWMFDKVSNPPADNFISVTPMMISTLEADQNVGALPFQVRKALVNDLCK